MLGTRWVMMRVRVDEGDGDVGEGSSTYRQAAAPLTTPSPSP